jgi:hypothetical protein
MIDLSAKAPEIDHYFLDIGIIAWDREPLFFVIMGWAMESIA